MLKGEAFVLTGGSSSRMGRPKAFLPYAGSTLLEVALTIFDVVGLPVRLLADSKQAYENLGLPVLVDPAPGLGPLGAIFTGLSAAQSHHCFFLASDMPLVRPELFSKMVELAPDWDGIIPRDSQGRLQTLSAYYSRTCLESIRRLLDAGERSVGKLLEDECLRILQIPIKTLGLSDDSFLNVNTPDDYRRLLRYSP